MTWSRALLMATGVVAYLVVSTVWLPHALLQLPIMRQAPRLVGDGLAVAAWLAALMLGMWLLRRLQQRGSI